MDERSIFLQALEKETFDERMAFIQNACTHDESFRRNIELLLRAHDSPDDLLPEIAHDSDATTRDVAEENVGTEIGPYKILQVIGEGGMGIVYMAAQTEPVDRRVALKIIKPGMDSKQIIARFEAERQALALMDHPNIAKILDAGRTRSGRPYFVMELVRGLTINRFCDEQEFTPRQRLQLLLQVCHAVQHAHQKGIIHRDLKPTNVLVAMYDDQPVPKVIDFGVAKATGDRLTDKTIFTRFGQVMGTFEYMSPEQAQLNQLDVDTRSDVYALGAILYELLTSEPPFAKEKMHKAAFDEVLRMIREDEPVKPSTRLSGNPTLPKIASVRKTETSKLPTLVRGDLDWIVMKALEKNRALRYQTASAFAADIENYLNDDPVEARPPSHAYRFRKFARRNRAYFVLACVFVGTLLIGLAGTTWQMLRAVDANRRSQQLLRSEQRAHHSAEDRRQEAEAAERKADEQANRARTQAAIVKAVNAFFNDDLLAQASPDNQPDRDIKLRAVLDRASARIGTRFANQPLVEAEIRHTLGMTYISLGAYELAEPHQQRALAIYQHEYGPENIETLAAMNNLATLHEYQGNYSKAESLFDAVLTTMETLYGENDLNTITCKNNLAWSIRMQGRNEEAEPLFKSVLELRRLKLPKDHPDLVTSLNDLGALYHAQRKFDQAEPLLADSVASLRRVRGDTDPTTLRCMHNLAALYKTQERYKEAESLFDEVIQIRKRVLPENHPATLASLNNLAGLYRATNRLQQSKVLYQEVLDSRRIALPRNHPDLTNTMYNLAVVYLDLDHLQQAETLNRECLEINNEVRPDSWQLARMKSLMGATLCEQAKKLGGNPESAKQKLVEAKESLKVAFDHIKNSEAEIPTEEKHSLLTKTAERMIYVFQELGQVDESKEWRNVLKQLQKNH